VTTATTDASDTRLRPLLEAAIGVFRRFGYRKASMDDVARAAGVSRQGLYLMFSNKEELFRKALEHALNSQLTAALAVLSDASRGLDERLIAACDEWAGRFVGSLGADATDLMCAGTALAGDTLTSYGARFEQGLAAAIGESVLTKRCRNVGVEPGELARALHATTRGLKQTSASREEFSKGISASVRMMCSSPK
jgi:AcrR family transcriptional regulator